MKEYKFLEPKKIVNLLWTGGWDSTFRLCQLILVKRKNVQPYYIIDNKRKSLQKELITMDILH